MQHDQQEREENEAGHGQKSKEGSGDEIESEDNNTGAEKEDTDGMGGQDNNEEDSSEEAGSEEDHVDKQADEVIYLQEIHKHVERVGFHAPFRHEVLPVCADCL